MRRLALPALLGLLGGLMVPLACVLAQPSEDMVLIGHGESQHFIDRYEVSVSLFQAFDPEYKPAYEYFMDATMPATAVTFTKALAYCRAKGKRLPTPEEWQIACRGSRVTEYSYGGSYDPTKARSGRRIWTDGPKAVGTYEPNGHGLYDMSGNVWEWVDSGEAEGEHRSVMGGSWVDGPGQTRCASKRRAAPDVAAVNYGFRCARSINEGDRAWMARQEAEKDRKQRESAAREAARVRARLEAKAAARRAEADARAEKLVQARESERRSREQKRKKLEEAFARTVEGMVIVSGGTTAEFHIDPQEITVSQYRAHDPAYRPDEFSSGGSMPATGLTFKEASVYCQSVGKRLPTREEWVAACFGGGGNLYSYGRSYDAAKARTGLPGSAGAAPVGGSAANDYGAHDMVGNVWEWVDGYYDGAQALRPTMGGSWLDGQDRAKCTGESWASPGARPSNVGFRCVVGAEWSTEGKAAQP
jgi:formylglycine-generating enzyme required for sulfatase activity